MPRPILATVHPEALRHNLQRARDCAPDARVWAVVKANAYGHGIERCFEALRSADGFALLDLDEAQRIRALDWRGPILLLEGVFEPRDLELCSRLHLWHTVHCTEQIDWLAAHKTLVPHRVFLKLNSGMNRLGFTPNAFRSAWARLNALPQVEEISLMTHFSDADGPRGIAHQVAAFEAATADLPGERTLCNSAAMLRHPGDALRGEGVTTLAADWVREGIALYGSAPDFPGALGRRLEPATGHDLVEPHHRRAKRCRPVTPWATARPSRPTKPCASAWWPAAMPMVTRATRPTARRCWWTACAPGWWGGSAWTW